MVMRPEPRGRGTGRPAGRQSRQGVRADGTPDPGGADPIWEPFSQRLAGELAVAETLAFACGRYEGIDRRVIDWASGPFDVREVSMGDYVLNGGEVAVLAMIEAIARLIPGVIGNPESLVEESHSAASDGSAGIPGLHQARRLAWARGTEVLLSGHHQRVAQWRSERAREITAARRPDLIG